MSSCHLTSIYHYLCCISVALSLKGCMSNFFFYCIIINWLCMHLVGLALQLEVPGSVSAAPGKIRHMLMSQPVLNCVCSKLFVYSTYHWTPCTNYFLAGFSECRVQSQLSSVKHRTRCDMRRCSVWRAAISPRAELRPSVVNSGSLSDVSPSLTGLFLFFYCFFQKMNKTEAR